MKEICQAMTAWREGQRRQRGTKHERKETAVEEEEEEEEEED